MTTQAWTYCTSPEWPQAEIEHCDGCHDEWADFNNGTIDCDHRMNDDLKDGRVLQYCCRAIDWFEEEGLMHDSVSSPATNEDQHKEKPNG